MCIRDRAHILPDVLVAHGGLFVAYAHLVQGLIQAEVAHYGGDEGIGIQPAALLHVAGAHIHYLVARDIGAVFVHGEAAVGVAVEGLGRNILYFFKETFICLNGALGQVNAVCLFLECCARLVESQQLKSRTLSGMKPIKPQKCKFDSIDCTPTCKYYKTCVHLSLIHIFL